MGSEVIKYEEKNVSYRIWNVVWTSAKNGWYKNIKTGVPLYIERKKSYWLSKAELENQSQAFMSVLH